MPISRSDLFQYFDQIGVAHTTTEHAPIFTVEEGQAIKAELPGAHTKNLFLKDKAGQLFLICARGDTVIRLNKLHPVLGSKRLSFGKPELLLEHLGMTPGSVCLFAILNDPEAQVRLVIDKALVDAEIVNFHPLLNTATTAISSADMIKFAKAANHEPLILDFTALSET